MPGWLFLNSLLFPSYLQSFYLAAIVFMPILWQKPLKSPSAHPNPIKAKRVVNYLGPFHKGYLVNIIYSSLTVMFYLLIDTVRSLGQVPYHQFIWMTLSMLSLSRWFGRTVHLTQELKLDSNFMLSQAGIISKVPLSNQAFSFSGNSESLQRNESKLLLK